ncbi:hypothetical protein ACGF0D_40885 [Kitasatospora sp. NPDC048298]|uniref:hypothetical protein n=1 Tax=Kitasatospora sp. NPDC048298 TaxID=3364049 RepID=UPI0037213F43
MTRAPTRPTAVPSIEQLPQPKPRTNTDTQGDALDAFTPSISTLRLLAEGRDLPNKPVGS